MAVKGLRNLCRAPYIYLVVSVILLIMILAGMMFYKNSKEGYNFNSHCNTYTTESTCNKNYLFCEWKDGECIQNPRTSTLAPVPPSQLVIKNHMILRVAT